MAQLADPRGTIEAERNEQRQLCFHLEQIADRLPNAVNRFELESIATFFKHKLPTYNRNEESLYALIAQNGPKSIDLLEIAALAAAEHRTHESFAEEFLDYFQKPIVSSRMDECGYMLRYFFEMIERHLDWEDLILIPLAKNCLHAKDLAKLADRVSLCTAGLLPR